MTSNFKASHGRNKNNDLSRLKENIPVANSSYAQACPHVSTPVCSDLRQPLLLHTLLELYTNPLACLPLSIASHCQFFSHGHSVGETSSSTCTICPVGRASPSAGLAGLSSCAFCDAGRCQWMSLWGRQFPPYKLHCGDSDHIDLYTVYTMLYVIARAWNAWDKLYNLDNWIYALSAIQGRHGPTLAIQW